MYHQQLPSLRAFFKNMLTMLGRAEQIGAFDHFSVTDLQEATASYSEALRLFDEHSKDVDDLWGLTPGDGVKASSVFNLAKTDTGPVPFEADSPEGTSSGTEPVILVDAP